MPMDKSESLSPKKRKDETQGNDDRMGEPIERSVLFAENNATSNENRVSLKKSAGNAQRLLKDAATEQNLILAAASPSQQIVTLYDERSLLPAKRRKIGVEENNEYYQAPKTTPKPAFLEPIKNAHLSIRRGKWNKAKENLNCALQLLEPMVSVTAQSLYECARTASTKSHYVVSILLYVCSASQFRKEMIPTDGSFKTSNCIFKICEATMQALKATNSEELTRSNVRFNDIAERFVIPLVTNEYEKLKQFGKAKNIMQVAAVQHSAFAGSWFAVLLNFLGSAEKAAEIAEEARKQLEQCSPGSHQTHARLLHEEGKASIQLKKHDDARDLLNNSLKIANTYDSQSVLYIRKSIEDNELKQAATQQHSSLNYQPNCEDLVKF